VPALIRAFALSADGSSARSSWLERQVAESGAFRSDEVRQRAQREVDDVRAMRAAEERCKAMLRRVQVRRRWAAYAEPLSPPTVLADVIAGEVP
jgi:hypothetical protein